MVNGIPLAVIECKKSSVDVKEGVLQNVRNMGPEYIPHLFKFTQLVMAMNPNKVVYGTCGTTADYFVEWREDDVDWQKQICQNCSPDGQILEQDRITASLLDKKRLLTLIHDYILYDSNIKKICRHQQFFAVENAVKRINGEDNKGTTGGVIWHTQGSGKSLTMVMLVKWFMQLSHKYEVERLELKAKIKTLRQKLSECGQCERDRETFTSAIRRFMRMDRLTAPLLRELIDHIDVFETEGIGKSRTQRIVIYYRFVGYVEIPEVSPRQHIKADTRKGVAVEYITEPLPA